MRISCCTYLTGMFKEEDYRALLTPRIYEFPSLLDWIDVIASRILSSIFMLRPLFTDYQIMDAIVEKWEKRQLKALKYKNNNSRIEKQLERIQKFGRKPLQDEYAVRIRNIKDHLTASTPKLRKKAYQEAILGIPHRMHTESGRAFLKRLSLYLVNFAARLPFSKSYYDSLKKDARDLKSLMKFRRIYLKELRRQFVNEGRETAFGKALREENDPVVNEILNFIVKDYKPQELIELANSPASKELAFDILFARSYKLTSKVGSARSTTLLHRFMTLAVNEVNAEQRDRIIHTISLFTKGSTPEEAQKALKTEDKDNVTPLDILINSELSIDKSELLSKMGFPTEGQ